MICSVICFRLLTTLTHFYATLASSSLSYEGAQFNPLAPYQIEDSLPPPVFDVLEDHSHDDSNSSYARNLHNVLRSNISLGMPMMSQLTPETTNEERKSSEDTSAARIPLHNINVPARNILATVFRQPHGKGELHIDLSRKAEHFQYEPRASSTQHALHETPFEDERHITHPTAKLRDSRWNKIFPFEADNKPSADRVSIRQAQNRPSVFGVFPKKFFAATFPGGRPSESFSNHHYSHSVGIESSKISGEQLEDDTHERIFMGYNTPLGLTGNSVRNKYHVSSNPIEPESYYNSDEKAESHFCELHDPEYRGRRSEAIGRSLQGEMEWSKGMVEANAPLDQQDKDRRNPQVKGRQHDFGMPLHSGEKRRRLSRNMPWSRKADDGVDRKDHSNGDFQEREKSSKGKRDDTNERFGSREIEKDVKNELAADWLGSGNVASQNLSSARPDDWLGRLEQEVEPTESIYEGNEPDDSSSTEYSSEEPESRRKTLHQFADRGNLEENEDIGPSCKDKEGIASLREKGVSNNIGGTPKNSGRWGYKKGRSEWLLQYENKQRRAERGKSTEDDHGHNNIKDVVGIDHMASLDNLRDNAEYIRAESHHILCMSEEEPEQVERSLSGGSEYSQRDEGMSNGERAKTSHGAMKQHNSINPLHVRERKASSNNATVTKNQETNAKEKISVYNATWRTSDLVMRKSQSAVSIRQDNSQNRRASKSASGVIESESEGWSVLKRNDTIDPSYDPPAEISEGQKIQKVTEGGENSDDLKGNETSTLEVCNGDCTTSTLLTSNITTKTNTDENATRDSIGDQQYSIPEVVTIHNELKKLIGNQESYNRGKYTNNKQRSATEHSSDGGMGPELNKTYGEQAPKSMPYSTCEHNQRNKDLTVGPLNYCEHDQVRVVSMQKNAEISKNASKSRITTRKSNEAGDNIGKPSLDDRTISDASDRLYHSKGLEHQRGIKSWGHSEDDTKSNTSAQLTLYDYTNDEEERDVNKPSDYTERPVLPQSDRSLDHALNRDGTSKLLLSDSPGVSGKNYFANQRNYPRRSEKDPVTSTGEGEGAITELLGKKHIRGKYSPLSDSFPEVEEQRTLSRNLTNRRMEHSPTATRVSTARQSLHASIQSDPDGEEHSRRPPIDSGWRSNLMSIHPQNEEDNATTDSKKQDKRITVRPNKYSLTAAEENERNAGSEDYLEPFETGDLRKETNDERSSSVQEVQRDSAERQQSRAVPVSLLERIPSFEDWIASIPSFQRVQFPFTASQNGQRYRSNSGIPFLGTFSRGFPQLIQQPCAPSFSKFLPHAQPSRRRLIEEYSNDDRRASVINTMEHNRASDRGDESADEDSIYDVS